MTPIRAPLVHRTASKAKPTGQVLTLLLLLLAQPTLSLAGITGESATLDRPSVVTPSGNPILIAPFIYIPPAGASALNKESEQTKRSPDHQRIVNLNAAGKYQTAGSEGLALIAKEETDEELQLIVANSLAWTGRLKEAVSTYQGLAKGTYANEANVGLANVYRWSGRDDQAAPLYRTVLVNAPDNAEALQGLTLALRELRPKTTLSLGRSTDSSDTLHQSGAINHRWRDASGTRIMEIETSAVQDELPNIMVRQQEVSFAYQDLGMALKPSFKLSMPTTEDHTLYGSARIKLLDDKISLEVGRVNWGRMVTNPNALAAHLSATHAGITAAQNFELGKLSGNFNHYSISDNNTIQTGGLQFASAWRPLGNHFKPFVGVEVRSAAFNTSNYWSPEDGSGAIYAGLLGEWGDADWNLFASGQAGRRLYGDAGQSWSLSAGGKRWLSDDIALSLNLWSMASTRDSATYRANAMTVSLEKLWP